MAGPAPLNEAYFRVLRTFGKNKLAQSKRDDGAFLDQYWAMACEAANLPVVPRNDVITEWKACITGASTRTSLALDSSIDPSFVCVAVLYHHKSVAAHTLRTRTLLRELLRHYSRAFPVSVDFLGEIETLAKEVATTSYPSPRGSP